MCCVILTATCLGLVYLFYKDSMHLARQFLIHPFLAFCSLLPVKAQGPLPKSPSLSSRKRRPNKMRYHKAPRYSRKKSSALKATIDDPCTNKVYQAYEAFLVVDIEGTCKQGGTFDYPNEIIEFPVCLLKWTDKSPDGRASTLQVVDEFRSFVKPIWRPTLSEFCTQLTGITQDQVDSAPTFTDVLDEFEVFLEKNGLIDLDAEERLTPFCWCSDGPFDIRDFVVKQCFISKVCMPFWFLGDVLDVRTAVLEWSRKQVSSGSPTSGDNSLRGTTRRSLNIPAQLHILDLPAFEGRQHCGIDDTRNVAKVVTELARRGVPLFPNTAIHPGRRWRWMGKRGQILEDSVD